MPKIGYIVSQFPSYDETFINRELTAVKKQGVAITIFSLKQSRDKIVHREAEGLLENLYVLPIISCLKVWLALAIMASQRPVRLIQALCELFRQTAPSFDFLSKGLLMVPLSCAFALEVEKRGVTHLHAHWATHPTTMSLLIAKLTKVSFSFTGHAHDIHLNTTGLAYKLQQAKFVLTCTAANKKHLLSIAPQLPEDKIIVSYHGLETKQTYYPAAKPPPQPPLNLLSVGSCLPCKGYDRLLHACAGLLREGINLKLVIVGGGPEEKKLQQLSRQLGLEQEVTFAGFVKQENMPNYYRQANCFVLAAVPEIHWGIPNVVVEALACGLPVITTALPALSEIINNNDAGILLPSSTQEELIPALKKLAANPEMGRQMGETGRKRICKMFDLERNASEITELFSNLKPLTEDK